ncbi:Chitinase D [Aquicella siphonis]|uniref:chitinase n=1 Tax=Aquicella siphonis TaxID=254247 RepID=A0A5E4PH80_9COXI|nr:glycosyl hydrolase family 18 protein [Aquicella siphonis]VVC75802.1 Chitinase D [Aquicella siphonis]
MQRIILFLIFILMPPVAFAGNVPVVPSQAASCIQTAFSNSGSKFWKTIYLKITNQCGQAVDFQNTTVTFLNTKNLNTSFWGDFNPLSYPDNNLQITSRPQVAANYLSTFYLHFPTYPGANSKLPIGKSITIIYGAATADYVPDSVSVYLGTPVNTGEIDLTNSSPQPANVTQSYALVHLAFNGLPLSDVQVPWSNTIKISNLAAGDYTVSPVSVTDSLGNVYQGTANPAAITLISGMIASSVISYAMIPSEAGIAFKVQALPPELSGYTNNPALVLTNTQNGSSANASVNWNTTTTVSGLISGASYRFSTPAITYNGYYCAATFNPVTAVAAKSAPVVNLAYACTPVAQDNVTINVNGVPAAISSVSATLTPNNGAAPVTQTISLSNGQGSSIIKLTDGVIYTVSSTNIGGYNATYNPQPLTATSNASETISYAPIPATGGRIIGYLPGWKTPPSANALAAAGYTHILVAFGVFSTVTPGQITPAFDTVTPSYIKSLQALGIKVLLSLGGASTSIPNTTVNFHQVLQKASSTSAFTQTFIQSLESLVNQYGFDGFDIDIESGLTAGGTFANPQGDIAVLAGIINTMHANHPSLLLTLAPQTANIAVTSTFNETWGNYSSLIMQTHDSLAWVGVQLYNSGCMLGIDGICYDPNTINSPNFSVAMATDLLVNWPSNRGYLPYVSYLKPSQVVLGYLVPNAQGGGDGSPVIPVSTIKRAVQCLRTGVVASNSCDTYIPPKTYPGIGGVFGWEVTYDQNNNFKFAAGLSACVINGSC